jgi:restriction system protein
MHHEVYLERLEVQSLSPILIVDATTTDVWVIRAGVRGAGEEYFKKKSRSVLEDPGLGDLNKIEPNRQAFYQAYASLRSEASPTSIRGVGGKFFRFIHEIKRGDVIVYPSIGDRVVHLGVFEGEYEFVPKDAPFSNQRRVRWTCSFPKMLLSQGAQYELGAARTLYRYRKHVGEILSVTGKIQQKETTQFRHTDFHDPGKA